GCFLLVRSANSNSLSIVSIHFVFVYSFFRIGQSKKISLENPVSLPDYHLEIRLYVIVQT
ncbi:hypothetical protein, partial [Sphingobacterium lactis]|uniref:hypothetical protein n=1 Tax=Sphingobacterium lactis TaxID=797291 RepID=UPI001F3CBC06